MGERFAVQLRRKDSVWRASVHREPSLQTLISLRSPFLCVAEFGVVEFAVSEFAVVEVRVNGNAKR